MTIRPRYSLGRTNDGDVLLYDAERQLIASQVAFYSLRLDAEVFYTPEHVKRDVARFEDPRSMNDSIWRYDRWHRNRALLTQIRHRRVLRRRGLPYTGSTVATVDRRRVDHCFSCRARVDSALDAICVKCTLRNIICPNCGACGCSFESPDDPHVADDVALEDDVENWFLLGEDQVVFPPGSPPGRWTQRDSRSAARQMYQAYLESSTWRRIRTRALADACNRCERCGASDQILNVHHRTYERVGGQEIPEDLEVLCEPCHIRHHEYARAYINFIGREGM